MLSAYIRFNSRSSGKKECRRERVTIKVMFKRRRGIRCKMGEQARESGFDSRHAVSDLLLGEG